MCGDGQEACVGCFPASYPVHAGKSTSPPSTLNKNKQV